MVRLKLSLELNYEIIDPQCDFIFNIHAAHTSSQIVLTEQLALSQAVQPEMYTDPSTHNRYMRVSAIRGPFKVSYSATVDIKHHFGQPQDIAEVSVAKLPAQILSYIYPSRYCQSDRLHKLAVREFGALTRGYSRANAIKEWVQKHVTFQQNTTNSTTSAVDSLIEPVGVCRDFAHLMIALCRAINIPARFATGIDYGADPALGPTDFHAYVEVYLGDRWYIFDPSGTAIPMGFVRFGTGYDAASVAFATIFGAVNAFAPIISIEAVADAQNNFVMPRHCPEAISTDVEVLPAVRGISMAARTATERGLSGVPLC